ncbi:AMP-binding protein [Streptomyces sp. NPDC056549]|uniref:AMP-binding protein n=1 Tax=Streptomyces sp. NPDC056549 TaxID=3345864 RepID=UPI003691798D
MSAARSCPSVAEQILSWCAQTPDAPAVVQDSHCWTYRELERVAVSLAARLEQAGVQPGQVVAVTARRSFSLVAAWMAVLLRRCVLLPLDSSLTPAMRESMIAQSGAQFDLIIGGVDVAVRSDASVARLSEVLQAPATDLTVPPPPGPDEPAYVLFTSGSAGTPKAILGRHRSLAALLPWLRSTLKITPADRIPHLAEVGRDMALLEVLLPLSSGASLCLPPPGRLAPADALPWLARAEATVLHAVPTVARAWLRAAPDGIRLPKLRSVQFSGEPLMDTLISRWRHQIDYRGEVVNHYGPTETTLIRCWHPVTSLTPGAQPLGRALPGSEVWVEQSVGVRAPVGTVGEIVIRTIHGTSGYLGADAETASQFTFEPEGEVTYRTGDLGAVDENGLIHFHGRLDDQVTVHGVRFHLHGVKAALEAQPEVEQAAVTTAPGLNGRPPRLTAHVVLTPDRSQVPRKLRAALLDHLPSAAVPGRFVVVEALPNSTTNAAGNTDDQGEAGTLGTSLDPRGTQPAGHRCKDILG